MSNSSQNNDTILRKLTRIHEVDRTTMVNAKLDILIKKLERMDMKAVDIAIRFKICRGGHASIECNILNAFSNEQNKEQANMTYFNQRRQRNLYSNTYNQGQRNHLNFLWKNQQEPRQIQARISGHHFQDFILESNHCNLYILHKKIEIQLRTDDGEFYISIESEGINSRILLKG